MKKGVKISLIVVPIVIVILAGASFGGTLLYTANNVDYTVGDTTISDNIIFVVSSAIFSGSVVTETPIQIANNGLYSILDLFITVTVLGQDFDATSLNGKVLGTGDNLIGTVLKGESWNGSLIIELGIENIPTLAIDDGELVIKVDISLKLDFGIFKAAKAFTEYQTEVWAAPFDII